MKRSKIIIANSVGRLPNGRKISHFPSRWTFSVTEKWKLNFYPYELAYLSSMLKRDTDHEVKMMDACLEDWDANQYIEKMSAEKPDFIVFDTASLIYKEDLKVAKELKKRFGTQSIFAGQHPTAFPDDVKRDGADYVCIGEFEETVLELFKGADPSTIKGLHPNGYRAILNVDSLPLPEDHDIPRIRYAEPYRDGQEYLEVEVYGSRGCPYSCVFCVCGNITYAKPNWRNRKVESIIEEIKTLKAKYPRLEGIFFHEEMHNTNKKWLQKLCRAIIDNGLNTLKYNAMCGYWGFDRETLALMKEAGYYKVRIGIESVVPDALKLMNKPLEIDGVYQMLQWAKEVGMKVYGTFTLGAWGSSRESDLRTLEVMQDLISRDLLQDFQVSISTPQPGTPFFNMAREAGYLTSENPEDYDGHNSVVVDYPSYPKAEIEKVAAVAMEMAEQVYASRSLRRYGPAKVFLESIRRRGMKDTATAGWRFLRRSFLPPMRKLHRLATG
jgi:anaerobic magnesium-protoporphyrin IX monomethyl ester cyclase